MTGDDSDRGKAASCEIAEDLKRLTRCPQCRYDLRALPAEHRCPECGLPYTRDTLSVAVSGYELGPINRIQRSTYALWTLAAILLPIVLYGVAGVSASLFILQWLAGYIVISIVFSVIRFRMRRAGGGEQLLWIDRDGIRLEHQRGRYRLTPWSNLLSVHVRPPLHRAMLGRRQSTARQWWRIGFQPYWSLMFVPKRNVVYCWLTCEEAGRLFRILMRRIRRSHRSQRHHQSRD